MTWRFGKRPTSRASPQELASRIAAATTSELLAALTGQDPKERELAAAYLGDQLVIACKAQAGTGPIVDSLVEALTRESDADAQEEIAHALAHLVEYGTVPASLVEPLQQRLPRLSPGAAEHVRDILRDADSRS
ncbi:hypothetical protein [Spirillospora sp. NPDC048819]|uniref:hypothetical protein n=1 Tax=Spirillospora sp. NPDC048819 TaxID=3155268 RepID=UPI0033D28B82